MYSSPLGAAIHAEPQLAHLDFIRGEFDYKMWKINPKGFDKDTPKFDGRPEHYRNWWNRLRDHLTGNHQPWGRLLDLVERARVKLSFQHLSSINRVDEGWIDLPWVAKELWCFLGPRLAEGPYSRRTQLAGGEDRNGIELWRKLYMENEGGAEQVALAGLRRLHRFPTCPSQDKLGFYLGE